MPTNLFLCAALRHITRSLTADTF